MDGRTSSGFVPLRRLTAGFMGAVLVGALVAPAAALAIAAVGNADLISTTEDHAAVTGNVITDPGPGQDVGIARSAGLHVDNATPGALTVAENGDYSFTPAADWTGTNVEVGYYYADPDMTMNGNELLTYIRVTVTAVNDVPVATPQSVQTNEDTDLPITLTGTDVENSPLTFAIATQPAHGTLAGSGASQTYTPAADYNGADSFTFTVNDGTDTSAPATITIDVVAQPDLPTADSQSVNVVYQTAKAITLTGGDVDGDTLAFAVLTQPTHGVLTGVAPNLTYTPAAGYHGPDSFTFSVTAGGDETAPATVSITIADDVTPPTVAAPTVAFGAGKVNESAPLKITWSATDAGTGVATYVVEAKVGTGAWTQVYSGSALNITKLYAFNTSLQWRVKASDHKGNWSDWTMSAGRRLYAYQGTSPVVTTGSWTKVGSTGSSGTTYYYTKTSGKSKALSFSGIGVLYVAPRSSTGGRVTVKIDTTSYAVNTWKSGSTSLGYIIKARSMASGTHTIRVTNAQGGRRANFDAFIVLK